MFLTLTLGRSLLRFWPIRRPFAARPGGLHVGAGVLPMLFSDEPAPPLPAAIAGDLPDLGGAGTPPGAEGAFEALMRAANRGDEGAYALLLSRLIPVLRGMVQRHAPGLGPETREDVVQVTLLTLHLKRQSWREDLPLLPWVHAIARHKAIDALRARGARGGTQRHVPIDDLADLLADPDAADPARRHDIDKMLGAIDPRAAEIVRGIGILGESAAEIGARLNMTEGAVRVALHRALRSLDVQRKRMIE